MVDQWILANCDRDQVRELQRSTAEDVLSPNGALRVMRNHWSSPPRFDATRGRLPRSIAVACDSRLEWELFDVLRRVDDVRVTACSGLRQIADLCARDGIQAAVIDLDHLGLDPAIHQSLGRLIGGGVPLLIVSRALAPAALDVRRFRWVQRPVSAEHLVFILRSLGRRSYVRSDAAG